MSFTNKEQQKANPRPAQKDRVKAVVWCLLKVPVPLEGGKGSADGRVQSHHPASGQWACSRLTVPDRQLHGGR